MGWISCSGSSNRPTIRLKKCEGERCLRLKLAVLREGFFDVIDKEEPDALDPTDEQDAERIEALNEELRGELRP